MGSDGLQVPLEQLAATAAQWQGLGAQLTATGPPPPGPPFQPTTAAVSAIDAMIGAAGAALAARTQQTATGITTAGAHYASQEAKNAVDMSGITQVRVV
ncbi:MULTISPECIES: hypothetical protein [unclassified Mycobacterium]|uniref:hypothetical protein n=1 Tax=unclassified Mycobacterium TaxID=2642494 RepID=UPI0007FC4450|nr:MULTISPECIES: hypothetical protein [unclassified Mycobacterium]OBG55783.1 hypothetical protein A5703_07495 [Mycobacterium sp. E188]OBH41081.1 hypothetical protein A5691_19330 [Mycobacterium sp. E183]